LTLRGPCGITLPKEATMKSVVSACLVMLCVLAAATSSPVSAQAPAPSLAKEMVATWQRATTEILDVAEAMPEAKYSYKPVPEISTFGDQLVHVAGITQRFIDSAKGAKTDMAHKSMTKADTIALLKSTFQTAHDIMASLTDAQLLEPVKFPFGDRTVTRATFWQGPLYQIRNHHGQLVVYLRMNGIVPPTTARR
jgi:uncharacterized damage-inducible protein DinB